MFNKIFNSEKFAYILQLSGSIFIIGILVKAIIDNEELWIRIFLSPFLICLISVMLRYVDLLFNKGRLIRIYKKIYLISFFSLFFGFLLCAFYYGIKNNESSLSITAIIMIICTLFLMIVDHHNNKKSTLEDSEDKNEADLK